MRLPMSRVKLACVVGVCVVVVFCYSLQRISVRQFQSLYEDSKPSSPRAAMNRTHTKKLVVQNLIPCPSDAPDSERQTLALSRRTGYVIAGSFREQQTKGADNLVSLQCWAKTLFVYIVEPFMQDSHLLNPMNGSESQLLRFRDVFDIEHWNSATVSKGFAPLTSWEQFLREAPREMIVVHFGYASYRTPHRSVNYEYMHGCSSDNTTTPSAKVKYLLKHNFSVVREVCFNFQNGAELNVFQFDRHLFGTYKPKEVTVYMEEWRGIAPALNGKRISITDACLNYGTNHMTYMKPSKRILCDAAKYQNKFIGTDQYIALVVRAEKVGLMHNREEKFILKCLKKTLDIWEDVKRKTGLRTTLLSMDIGKYGSTGMQLQPAGYTMTKSYESFVREIYGPSGSIQRWEESFESVTDIREPGYIGSLQKILSVHAKCIIFVGGGTFQRHAKFLYEKLHPKNKCVYILEECSKSFTFN